MANGSKDREIEALAAVSNVLADLDHDAVDRILRWAANRFGVELSPQDKAGRNRGSKGEKGPRSYEDISQFLDDARPQGTADMVLAVAYWFQEMEGRPAFGSQEVNSQLKHLGHGVTNITKALQRLIDKRPALVMQVRKKGVTKQARKQYKITAEGRRAVATMIESGSAE